MLQSVESRQLSARGEQHEQDFNSVCHFIYDRAAREGNVLGPCRDGGGEARTQRCRYLRSGRCLFASVSVRLRAESKSNKFAANSNPLKSLNFNRLHDRTRC
ncbi:uncharacterized protein V6R79_010845 [Siganus canaliculatus]